MPELIFSLKSTKYGTPTGTNTVPDAGSLTALPDTVKGTVSFDENDPTVQSFFVDQKIAPIRKTTTEMGEFMVTMQFYDMSYAVLEAIKGGTAIAAVPSTSAAAWEAPAGYTDIELALQLETDSGHYIKFYNAFITAKITGKGSRDGMLAVEMKATAQLSADGAGSFRFENVDIPT